MTHERTVLIIDDSKVGRLGILTRIHALRPDWALIEARDGDEARAALARAPDLITVDRYMPGVDGLDLIPELRRACPAATIVVVSADVQSSCRERASALGASFVSKPVSADDARAIVEGVEGQDGD